MNDNSSGLHLHELPHQIQLLYFPLLRRLTKHSFLILKMILKFGLKIHTDTCSQMLQKRNKWYLSGIFSFQFYNIFLKTWQERRGWCFQFVTDLKPVYFLATIIPLCVQSVCSHEDSGYYHQLKISDRKTLVHSGKF